MYIFHMILNEVYYIGFFMMRCLDSEIENLTKGKTQKL